MSVHEESEEFKNIQSMFPTWSKESLYSLYEANGFSGEVTIQSVLTIEGSTEAPPSHMSKALPLTNTNQTIQTELPRLGNLGFEIIFKIAISDKF